jgi:ArsR family transcriptional regulator
MPAVKGSTRSVGLALRLFADPVRGRILALLEDEELSVGELARSLELSQSRVSNHLRLLREAGLLVERHVGPSTFLRASKPSARSPLPARLWSLVRAELAVDPEHAADRLRRKRVLAERDDESGAFFDRLAGDWDKIAGAFESGLARERAASRLVPAGFVVADVGCGTGYMADALLGAATRLICIDRSPAMLDEARKRLAPPARATALEFRRGELEALPLADAEVDGVVAGMVLHHVPELAPALAEIRRALKPAGTLVIVELLPHREAWMKRALGDHFLGLASKDVLAALEEAGFEDLALEPALDAYRPRRPDADPEREPVSLSLYLVRARRPARD